MSSSNPFAALFSSETSINNSQTSIQNQAVQSLKINDIIEKIFGFTISKSTTRKNLIYLEDLSNSIQPQDWIDLDILDQCLFERLMLSNTPELDYFKSGHEKDVAIYLFNCYRQLKNHNNIDKSIIERITNVIVQNMITFLKQPDLFQDQILGDQLLQIILDNYECTDFFVEIAQEYIKDDDIPFFTSIKPLLEKIQTKILKSYSLVTVDQKLLHFILFLSVDDNYAEIFIDYNNTPPVNIKTGLKFTNTILGALLTLSILPKMNNGAYEYFDRPLDQVNSSLKENLWTSTNTLKDFLHKIILNLLKKSPTVKTKTLNWLGQCLQLNASRGKLWNMHAPIGLNSSYNVSDGFMINLANVLLELCIPFCTNIKSGKILKVDPTYCAVDNEDATEKGVHLLGLSEESCFLPPADDANNSPRPVAKSYSFVTECFYFTHRCLDLGFRICNDLLVRLNQDMVRIQQTYNDVLMQNTGMVSDLMDTLKTQMETEMQKFLSLKAVLTEPNFLSNLMKFHSATAEWLIQIAIDKFKPDSETFAPLTFKEFQLPLTNDSNLPDTLRCIPEFLIENIVGYLSFLSRFSPDVLETEGYEALAPIMTVVLIYMGSPERLRNPHMRARLAECLEAMLPRHDNQPENLNNLGSMQREKLFTQHPHRSEIVRTLLNVFVSIEMTGQSVEFEQKFNYRRPMYLVMDYLWELKDHRQAFVNLAAEAEKNMEAVNPPIYLCFVNLLMNDAVFLLDEALSNMAKIRTLETAKENGEWDQLSQTEREQNLAHLRQTGMLARFDNILGRDTTRTLRLLIANTTKIFTHSTMVDRVAAMLNYFLLHLVGPKKKNFKVKDLKKYEFDPAKTVLDICHMYVALGNSDAFCLAVSQDGRSYNSDLFQQAENVLTRIGGAQLIGELRSVAEKVERLAQQQKSDEELFVDAPDEFLDPIMSTIMLDPVILPSSKQTVDRTTIARHLLSDQTDPFNRSPLTMDQIEVNNELAERIKNWIQNKKAQQNFK